MSSFSVAILLLFGFVFAAVAAEDGTAATWKSLFNGKDLSNWDTYVASPKDGEPPLGLNNDPRGVFTVVQVDGAPAIRVSGEMFGGITEREEFDNFHIRVEYRWGTKRWPPRANVGRDSGLLYLSIGPPGAGSGAWMKSVECNIMEKGTGQFWSVAGSFVDVEGERVTPEMESLV